MRMAEGCGKPFLVKLSGSNYWLLEPPGNASPLVNKFLEKLTASSDSLLLANSSSTIDDVIGAMKECKDCPRIPIGSQCNNIMKHIQASAVYLFHYRDLAVAIVSKLHVSMKWLFDTRPPREIGSKEVLLGVGRITSVVRETAAKQFRRLGKSEVNVEENWSIEKFFNKENIHKHLSDSLIFWKSLTEHIRELEDLMNEITNDIPREMKGESFDAFKKKVILVSAGWTAIKIACLQHIRDIPSHELKQYAQEELPTCTIPADPKDFKDFAYIDLNVHLQNIECMLMTDDKSIQKEVVIYSSWVKPKLSTSVSECFQMVEEVTKLADLGKVREASKKLMQVNQCSKNVATVTDVYIQRLEALGEYGIYQQELLMLKMKQLEDRKQQKLNEIRAKERRVAEKRTLIADCEMEKEKAQRKQEEAEHERSEAEDRLDEVKTWWWVPIYGQILVVRELIEDNSSVIRDQERKIDECQNKKSDLQGKIGHMENDIANITQEVRNISFDIDKLKDESERRIKNLQEMKEATATLKRSVHGWNEFVSATEHGINRAEALHKSFRKASLRDDPKKALSSRGMKTTMKGFEEAYKTAEAILEKQWQYLVMYEYTCEVCQTTKSGLPMPVDKNTVVCTECAGKFIE